MLTLRPIPCRSDVTAGDLTIEALLGRGGSAGQQAWQHALKRDLDIGLAAIALLALLPVLLALAVIVRLDSPGPVLFRQRRVGLGGREFTMFKLRSMVQEAEELRQGLEQHNEADGVLFKIDNDPRITRVGSWLRRFSLDEIPQLINVVRGDMSLVGPRPALPSEVAAYDARTAVRLTVKPGLTGPWQVSERHRTSFEGYVSLDLDYVERWSVGGDVVLMARTVPAILRLTGA